MSFEIIIFYFISIAILALALATVLTKRILRAALYLFLTLLLVAGFYFYMDLQFLAGIQIAIYVGGIVVFIIFSIFLTDQAGKPVKPSSRITAITSMAGALAGISFLLYFFRKHTFELSSIQIDGSIERIGTQLLDFENQGYVLPFEVLSLLLLAALVGSILIIKSGKTRKI
jgi:NADH-quinone oxidoreductase subunit J